MDANTIATLVGSLGFPIVCCIALFWFITKLTSQHKEEIEKLREAIDNNTKVMTEVLGKFDSKEVSK